MAKYLRPRRGKKATAESQAIILKRGEVFFECPDTGVGTGAGKIKVGDGTTAYANLPYFMDFSSAVTDVASSTIAFTESSTTANATLLNAIKSGATLKTIIGSIKKLLRNLDTSVTKLNNDLANKSNSNHTHSNYVTESQVSSIVNTAISNGTIEVNTSMFKSITTYDLNKAAINITGKGMVTIGLLQETSYGFSIDGKTVAAYVNSNYRVEGNCYLFGTSLSMPKSNYTANITVAVFN